LIVRIVAIKTPMTIPISKSTIQSILCYVLKTSKTNQHGILFFFSN